MSERAVFINDLRAMNFAVYLLQHGKANKVKIDKRFKRGALVGYTVRYGVGKAWNYVTEHMVESR